MSIGKAFGTADMAKTQAKFELAIGQARSIEDRMSLFLESASDLLAGTDGEDGDLISDDELEALLAIDSDQPARASAELD